MTAVLFNNQLTAGGGWRRDRMTFDASYGYTLTGNSFTAKSALLAGEYNNSIIHTACRQ